MERKHATEDVCGFTSASEGPEGQPTANSHPLVASAGVIDPLCHPRIPQQEYVSMNFVMEPGQTQVNPVQPSWTQYFWQATWWGRSPWGQTRFAKTSLSLEISEGLKWLINEIKGALTWSSYGPLHINGLPTLVNVEETLHQTTGFKDKDWQN